MNLIINGKSVDIDSSIQTVSQLLESRDLHEKVVIVELNKKILQKQDHEKALLSEGDLLEIVSFVGGG
ncbi:sulfur carrier protein ThiS [Priestia flexa]|uniref:Thiamine biosynthesis protein ThiS n=2 Tax=Priestia TaxID=2800373 RepID=A0A0V8JQ19_9BACI|nr:MULTISPECIES: sulfur carrier protein ThiS [Bacillaceae]AQX55973.1 thiamine biosynthesis protein ThiS [Priestia flexa]KSU88752.1 thiamine biosynthesis protein ThiS [Priestia veravalensis]KZB92102.1 thiamine biosynthesis protein ThiS [Bacillus sp. VT 712]MBN8253534.1 sulfur carrier protein ThiS [Priestia flexa]MBN8435583.1 sulfur carrier protein ThiS [Priestia flexa]